MPARLFRADPDGGARPPRSPRRWRRSTRARRAARGLPAHRRGRAAVRRDAKSPATWNASSACPAATSSTGPAVAVRRGRRGRRPLGRGDRHPGVCCAARAPGAAAGSAGSAGTTPRWPCCGGDPPRGRAAIPSDCYLDRMTWSALTHLDCSRCSRGTTPGSGRACAPRRAPACPLRPGRGGRRGQAGAGRGAAAGSVALPRAAAGPGAANVINLGEGMTPMIPPPALREAHGLRGCCSRTRARSRRDHSRLAERRSASPGPTSWARRSRMPTAGNAAAPGRVCGAGGTARPVVMPADAPAINRRSAWPRRRAYLVDGLISDAGALSRGRSRDGPAAGSTFRR